MIFFGYQGIGKSSLSMKRNDDIRIIDLDSSNFRTSMNPNRADDWYMSLGNIAINLADQGFHVFCPTHFEVRNYIMHTNSTGVGALIYPTLSLREEWLYKLRQRFFNTKSDKDLRALEYAESHFIESIHEMQSMKNIDHIEIIDMKYSLDTIISDYLKSVAQINSENIIIHRDKCNIYPKGRRI